MPMMRMFGCAPADKHCLPGHLPEEFQVFVQIEEHARVHSTFQRRSPVGYRLYFFAFDLKKRNVKEETATSLKSNGLFLKRDYFMLEIEPARSRQADRSQGVTFPRPFYP